MSDNDSAAGNFAGAGASAPPVDGETKVNEVFMEALVPLFVGDGAFKSLDLDLGYRYSDYDRSGGANTYKLGLIADVGMVRPRVITTAPSARLASTTCSLRSARFCSTTPIPAPARIRSAARPSAHVPA